MAAIRLVEVTPYNPLWSAQYRSEADAILSALPPLIIEIHHIGSTAVPGLCAKPIIDILAVINPKHWRNVHVLALEGLAYRYKGEHGIPGRHFFIKPDEIVRTHHLHIFPEGHADILRHLALRDYLRAFPEHARRYGSLKTSLALTYPHDIDAYMNGKAGIVRELEVQALKWMSGRSADPAD